MFSFLSSSQGDVCAQKGRRLSLFILLAVVLQLLRVVADCRRRSKEEVAGVRASVTPNNKKVFVQTEIDPLSETNQSYYDIQIFHPPSQYQQQRPHWLSMNGYRHQYAINPDKHGMKYPCLLMAYNQEEDIDFVVPMDAIELKDERDAKSLMLPKGTYTLVMRDKRQNKKLEIIVE